MSKPTVLEICAGAGGQALGIEQAGFEHAALVEIDSQACETLRLNRPKWDVVCEDVNLLSGKPFEGVDLLAGGLPCPPFSIAGKQLGESDERNLFPAALRLVSEIEPKYIMIENVRGILDPLFSSFRENLVQSLDELGYQTHWHTFNAADFGLPQSRQRVVLVAHKRFLGGAFAWPLPDFRLPPTVGELLHDLMAKNGWEEVDSWVRMSNGIGPTIVGGSKKHGGPDLGPTRARNSWRALGVDGRGIADDSPSQDFNGIPRLTVRMVARLQGFPDDWQFAGKKTSSYRQVGNAFPPPIARAVASEIYSSLQTDLAKLGGTR